MTDTPNTQIVTDRDIIYILSRSDAIVYRFVAMYWRDEIDWAEAMMTAVLLLSNENTALKVRLKNMTNDTVAKGFAR